MENTKGADELLARMTDAIFAVGFVQKASFTQRDCKYIAQQLFTTKELNLIAAAPQMYEALQQTIKELDRAYGMAGIKQIIRKTLAKAEGGK